MPADAKPEITTIPGRSKMMNVTDSNILERKTARRFSSSRALGDRFNLVARLLPLPFVDISLRRSSKAET
jgi:hypothetical protein